MASRSFHNIIAARGLLCAPITARGTMNSSKVLARPLSSQKQYETLAVSTPHPYVAHVELNRPSKGNAMNAAFWREMVECFKVLGGDSDVRVIVISGRGKLFSGGLDLQSCMTEIPEFFDMGKDAARRARALGSLLTSFQQSFTQIEQCPQPVIAAIHNACIGGAIDLTTACDIRYCSEDAYFQVKEVDIGMAADVGTLQRLPKVVGNESFAKDICYTARKVYSKEALMMGLVSRVLRDKDSCVEAALLTAQTIAAKSPVAVQTTKEVFNYSRDHPVADSLNHVRLLNQCMLQSEDVAKAAQAAMTKETPVFSKL
ncbi:delta(3,5)-Delta(2,4)-dienoyl-CoA isomerase, mitochondrial-like [Watersipora subatra]|uniref:delta(3,5)-Delta(2,4)-dienoyl-CoA isomerase, mitochondrial-like n=1 Tax=Watersipora subatra TaxID=2589382 RepID=UPI00355B48A0